MSNGLILESATPATPLICLTEKEYAEWLPSQPERVRQWTAINDFKCQSGSFFLIPALDGRIESVVVGLSSNFNIWDLADLPLKLPVGTYYVDEKLRGRQELYLGWALGAYQFTKYKTKPGRAPAHLIIALSDLMETELFSNAIYRARDLINMPSNELGPAELAKAIKMATIEHGAEMTEIVGDDLITQGYKAVHMVGRAGRTPRLVDLTWGDPKHQHITLTGKGVCFDTGGIDLKLNNGAYGMKKDMAGAACVLAIAEMIMEAKLPVRLRLIVPAVDNVIGSNAYQPGDVITMRNGKTMEVTDTDAEGRIILADALVEASRDKPSAIFNLATLTGAARVALGDDISALFCNDEVLQNEILGMAKMTQELIHPLPLHRSYAKRLESDIADTINWPNTVRGSAINAALFLQQFVDNVPWAHFDITGWNTDSQPGRPKGGEATTVRALYRVIESRAQNG